MLVLSQILYFLCATVAGEYHGVSVAGKPKARHMWPAMLSNSTDLETGLMADKIPKSGIVDAYRVTATNHLSVPGCFVASAC